MPSESFLLGTPKKMVKRLKEDKTQHVFGSVVNLTKGKPDKKGLVPENSV